MIDYRVASAEELAFRYASDERCRLADLGPAPAVPLSPHVYGEPFGIASDEDRAESAAGVYYSQPQQLLMLKDARLLTGVGLVAVGAHLLRESTRHFPRYLHPTIRMQTNGEHCDSLSILKDYSDGSLSCAISALYGVQDNYYHWMVLTLPRLASLFTSHPWVVEGGAATIVFPELLQPFHRESAQIIAEQLQLPYLSVARNTNLDVGRLLVPNHVDACGLKPHPCVSETFATLKRALYRREHAQRLSIYVSRRDSPYRRLRNEAALETWLESRGYRVVSLSEMTLAEQVQLFAHAQRVIAPHGAGLTNLGFCEPGTRVLEIHMPGHFNRCYQRLAGLFELAYGYVAGSGVQTAAPDGRALPVNGHSYELPVSTLRRVLDEQGF